MYPIYVYVECRYIVIGALDFIALREFLFVFIIAATAIYAFHRNRFIIVGNSFQLPLNESVNIMGANIVRNRVHN